MSLDTADKSADFNDAGDAGGDDLQGTLAGGDTEFAVAEEKPRNNKNIALVGLVLIAAAVAYFMFFKQSPEGAEASPANEEKQIARQAIADFLGGGSANIAEMEKLLRNTEQVVGKFVAYPSTTQVPLEELKTNPFRHEIAEGSGSAAESELAAKKRYEEERQAAIKVANTLQLQSLISGKNKACMINNAMYREGQQVAEGCVIERINADSVVVRIGEFRFALKMQQ